MTNVFPNAEVNAKVAVELTELNVKTLTSLVDGQAKLFNDLLTSGLSQIQKLQDVKDIDGLIKANKSYSEEVNGKIRKAYDDNSKALEVASKQGLELIAKQAAVK